MEKEPKEPTDKEEQKVAHKAQEKNETPESPAGEDEGVTVSEEFQKRAHELVSGATKHEMKHLHDKAYAREDEMRKEEEMKNKKANGDKEFSSSDMPETAY